MKSAIVAGAHGFLGRNLIEKLLSKNVEVFALARNMNKSRIQNKKLTYFELNFNEMEDLAKILPKNIDAYFNMAWNGVSTTEKNDYSVQMKNIEYGLLTMKLMEKISCQKIIFPGSTSEYAYSKMPITPTSTPSPSDAYSACKLATKFICEMYAKQHDINLIWAPITSIYGPGRQDNNIITYTIRSLLQHKKTRYTNLEQEWDYIYISDLIDALFLLAEKDNVESGIYPIGSGVSCRLKEYIEIIRDMIDKGAILGIGAMPYKTNKIDNCVVDITALTNSTGFIPHVSFKDGITETIKYFRGIKE